MKRALLAAALLSCAAAGFAFDPEYIHPRLGLMIITNVVTGDVGAPDAVVNTFGASLDFPFEKNPRWSFQPGVDIYWTRYEWGSDERAHPTEMETAQAALVLGAILDAPVFYTWDFSESLQGMVGGGGAVILRAAFRASGSDSDTPVSEIGSWFYKKLRWFYPSTQFKLAYRLQEKFTFEFSARWFVPLFNVLDPEAPSFFDHSMIDLTLGMRIKLR